MQTFLPYPDFEKSAKVLDRQRLGKQRVECKQILNALHNGGGWQNHPAVKMWRGHDWWLAAYGWTVCQTWVKRDYTDSLQPLFEAVLADKTKQTQPAPPWLGDEAFHRSHRSNLTRKDPNHYGQYWDEPDDLPYVWPTVRQVTQTDTGSE